MPPDPSARSAASPRRGDRTRRCRATDRAGASRSCRRRSPPARRSARPDSRSRPDRSRHGASARRDTLRCLRGRGYARGGGPRVIVSSARRGLRAKGSRLRATRVDDYRSVRASAQRPAPSPAIPESRVRGPGCDVPSSLARAGRAEYTRTVRSADGDCAVCWSGQAPARRAAARNLCNFSLRTASGPEGSSAKQILTCAAGPPGRGGSRRRRPATPSTTAPHTSHRVYLSGHRPQVASAALRRRDRPARRHADAAQRDRRRPHRPVVRLLRSARGRQDDDGADPGALPQLRQGADCRSVW